tara:strand:- start:2637 stop:3119 length:483 start_codon:yes stop_codon:yes gene_type:complete
MQSDLGKFMDIKTYGELINWTRDLHHYLGQCLKHCAGKHADEKSASLLEYLSSHESEIATIIDEFEHQSARNTLDTRVYDYLRHNAPASRRECDEHYARMAYADIYHEVMGFHEEVTDLFKTLSRKAEIPEARDLLEALLEMETNESMRLSRQIGRMDDL